MTRELWAMSAAAIAEGVATGAFSAREATQAALVRMDAVNGAVNAVVDRFDAEALAEADAVDAARAAGAPPGPLAGVPVTVKVNVDQKGRANTNGLRLQRDLIATRDSPVVAALRAAGAVIVGRTNTPAFSIRWFARNSLHGATRNPRAAGVTPGGSSGGAGAAVAAGIGAVGHGTDIAGSIRYPAYACGVHGLRPSLGRVAAFNASGPERHLGAQITAVSGPLAREIGDLRLALEAMAAPSDDDPWAVPAPLVGPPAPRRVALCVGPEGLAVAPAVEAALRAAADRLADAGWAVEERPCPPLRRAAQLQMTLWLSEARRSAAAAVAQEGDPDAIEVWSQLEAVSPPVDLNGFLDALQERAGVVRAWRRFLAETPLVLLPVSAEPPFDDHADLGGAAAFARIWEAQLTQVGLPLTGLPALAVATAPSAGRPMGVQLVAGPFREDLLFDAGAVIADPAATAAQRDIAV